MWEMALTSIKLFLAGKLFQHPWSVFAKSVIGAGLTALVAVGLVGAGLPLLFACALAGLLGGGLQPYLFKDLKYR